MIYSNEHKKYLSEWLLTNSNIFTGECICNGAGIKIDVYQNLIYGLFDYVSQESIELIIRFLNSISFNFPVSLVDFEAVICKYISEYYNINVTKADLKIKTRKEEIVLARQLSMIYRHKQLKVSQSEAVNYYGLKNHATLIHGIISIKNLVETEPQFSQTIKKLSNDIGFNFNDFAENYKFNIKYDKELASIKSRSKYIAKNINYNFKRI